MFRKKPLVVFVQCIQLLLYGQVQNLVITLACILDNHVGELTYLIVYMCSDEGHVLSFIPNNFF